MRITGCLRLISFEDVQYEQMISRKRGYINTVSKNPKANTAMKYVTIKNGKKKVVKFYGEMVLYKNEIGDIEVRVIIDRTFIRADCSQPLNADYFMGRQKVVIADIISYGELGGLCLIAIPKLKTEHCE